MKKKRINGLKIILLTSIPLLASYTFVHYGPKISQVVESFLKDSSKDAKTSLPVANPEFLQQRLQDVQFHAPTSEEVLEEQAFESEQIEMARQWLLDLDEDKRINGIEQLSAYPTEKAEALMRERLNKDSSAQVRAAAADYLSYFEKLDRESYDALLSALKDYDESVRNNALNTIQSFINNTEEEQHNLTSAWLIAVLRKQGNAKAVPEDVRKAIKAFLADQSE